MFLKEVIKDIIAENPSWDKMVIILPSNRSIREFKRLLSKEIEAPIFSPKFFTIEGFITEVSGLTLCNPLNLQLWLYDVYQKNNPNNKEDYTSFSDWANNALNDFNEIDRYLIPYKEIFDYLSAISSIKNWTPNEKPTSLISEYTKFIKGFTKLYTELNKFLFARGLGYQGMLYRHAVNNIDVYLQSHIESSFKIISLNALNNAEKTILNTLLAIPTTKIYWDIDNLFLEDKQHSAGYFIRQNLSFFAKYGPKQKQFSNNASLKKKAIQITGVPKNISQAKLVGQLLQTINFDKGPVALVLADETLLPAILNSIPKIGCEVNITMGYPIQNTQAYMFLKCILALKGIKQNEGYYYKDVERFLNNPMVLCLLNSKEILLFGEKIRRKNDIHIKKSTLREFLQPNKTLSKNILQKQPFSLEIESLVCLFSSLIADDRLKTNKIELESCSLIISGLRELNISVSQLSHKFIAKDLDPLIESQLQENTISFKGNPNEGLQIMGLLETRALDFETVLMTSVNEGVLPAGKSYNSFIPYDVKHEFGLPTIKEKDAIYTYHFYRLLQGAKKIHLIYNTEPDVLKGGEPSRFIYQLTTQEQLTPYVKHTLCSPKISSNKSVLKKVDKTELLIAHIKMMASKGFSPSSLAKYIRNPFDFYMQFLGIETPESVDEDIAYNVLGSIIHDSLEKLYRPLLGQELTTELFEKAEQDIERVIFSEFEKHYTKNTIVQGKNLVLFQVVKKYVQSVISKDRAISENQELKIIALEHTLNLNLELKDGTKAIVKGKLDRIDMLNGQLRILDYKTGTVENSGLNVTHFDDLFINKKYEKAFQLLCYALLFHTSEDKLPSQAAIVPIKQINRGTISLKVDKSSQLSVALLQKFKLGLLNLIEEILDPKKPFIDKKD